MVTPGYKRRGWQGVRGYKQKKKSEKNLKNPKQKHYWVTRKGNFRRVFGFNAFRNSRKVWRNCIFVNIVDNKIFFLSFEAAKDRYLKL